MILEPITYDLFISYTAKDQDWVEYLAERLENGGSQNQRLRVFMMSRNLDTSNDLVASELDHALRSSRALAVVITPESIRSEWVNREISTMLELDRPVFPLYRR